MNTEEIIPMLRPAFPDVYGMDTGGGIVCPSIRIGDNGAYALVTFEEDGWTVGLYDYDSPTFNPDMCIVLDQGTFEQAVAMVFALRAKQDILGDFEPEQLAKVHSFSDLHNVCDANAYLEQAFVYAGVSAEAFAFLNELIDMVEALDTFSRNA